jgi:hypothetical protein
MAGPDPAIHVLLACFDKDVDARDKPGTTKMFDHGRVAPAFHSFDPETRP